MSAFDNLNLPSVDPSTPSDQVIGMLTREGMPFETTEQEINGVTHTVFANQPPSLREAFMMFLGHGDKEFMVYDDERLTFKDTIARASMFAQALVDDFGVKKGDRVALSMRNYPEWPIAYMGIIAAGGVAVVMNAWWTEEEIAWGIKDSGAKVAVTDGERALRFMTQADMQIIVARDVAPEAANVTAMATTLEGKKPFVWPTVDLGPEDLAMIMYTSGSSGFPKGALSTHRAVVSLLMNWVCIALSLKMLGRLNPDPDFQPVMLVAVPFFHITGLLPVLFVSATIGRKLVMMYKWDVEEAFRLIEKEGVTTFTGVPTMSYEMAASDLRGKYDLSTLTDIGGGGAARPPEHVKLIKKSFPNANPGIGYGLTETNSLTAVLSADEYVDRPTSTGKPTPPLIHVRITDPATGKELPAGEPGEVCIKSVVNIREYWNNPEATARAFKDGWFHSGDVGYLDDEGYLYIVDRLKDIIIRGGENISSLEVEGVLHAHDAVDDVMVFSLPDERLGELVGAVVSVNRDISEADLKAEVAKHLAAFKVPEKIWITHEPLPIIASGKIDRKGIKEQYRGLWAAAAA
ncbi:class I adenylate-forming enzyme family protein [Kordiimonas lacus]|uniref:AMP-binding enzyme C-terminal domain-containing protein n=1 Tax=Kordiimonas lacus TaxID=637679 RepID=A0A1G7CHB3_9PROT|nr:class I adenylate-forming enzyme family protein [Kordiimonas lacus]SDE38774.1 AMP-binding enzyme C-terminal domain-containing protein [Kordiimonas lacus]